MKSWNGTVIDQQTIRDKLKQYNLRFFKIMLLLGGLLLFTIGMYYRETGNILGSIHYIQDFFRQIEEIQEQTGEFLTFRRKETQEALEMAIIQAKENLEKLDRMEISGNYKRNLLDLRWMLKSYEEVQKNVMDRKSEVSEGTEKMLELSEAIFRKEKVLNTELYSYYDRRREVMQKNMLILAVSLAMTAISAFCLLESHIRELTKQIADPLLALSDEAKKIQLDGLEHISLSEMQRTECAVEVTVLCDTFERMLTRISEQVGQLEETMRIKEELKEKQMENLRVQNELVSSELKCLQMQMNPHFLFNILNMIQQTLYLNQTDKTSRLLQETAAYLRYSLDYVGKTVTLEQELVSLGYYTDLQEERMGERISFEFILDERLSKWRVPCLILQPLVENSIIHGVAGMIAGAEIIIRTAYDEKKNCGQIQIEDNGAGIEPDKLKELRDSLLEGKKQIQERIGMHNVARRLELFECGQAWLDIDSVLGQGTTVFIYLSGQMEVGNDSGTDCR